MRYVALALCLTLAPPSIAYCQSFDKEYDLAESYFYQGAYDTALYYYMRSHKAVMLVKQYSAVYNGIGKSYGAIGQYDSSLVYFQKAIPYARRHNDSLGLAKLLGNTGNTLQYLDSVDAALQYYQESYRIKTRIGADLDRSYNKLGDAYRELEQYDSAKVYYTLSLELAITAHDSSKVIGNLGSLHMDQGRHDEAIPYFRKSLSLGSGPRIIMNAHKNLYTCFKKQLRADSALAHYISYADIERELEGERAVVSLAEVRDQQREEAYINEIENLMVQIQFSEQLEEQNARVRNWMLFCTILVGMLGVLAVFLYQNLRRKVIEHTIAVPEAPQFDLSFPEIEEADQNIESLSHRQKVIYTMLGQGLEVAEIAAKLGIKDSSVRTHIRGIVAKLRVYNLKELREHAFRSAS